MGGDGAIVNKYSMRCYDLFEGNLWEERAVIDGNTLTLLKNPSPLMLIFFIGGTRRGIARGALIHGDAYYFDACLATHEEVQSHFGVPVVDDGFDVAEIIEDEQYLFACQEHALDKLLANNNVRRSIDNPRIKIAREDGSHEDVLSRIGRC